MDGKTSILAVASALQHPLPEELSNMDHEDTVCKFCGVSYLIHNEVKKLEKRIQDLEAELKLKESVANENQRLTSRCDELDNTLCRVHAENSSLLNAKNVLEATLEEKNAKIIDLQAMCNILSSEKENTLRELSSITPLYTTSVSALPGLKQMCKSTREIIKNLRKETLALRELHDDNIVALRGELSRILISQRGVVDQLKSQLDSCVAERDEARRSMSSATQQVEKLQIELQNLSDIDRAYSQLKSMYESLQTNNSELNGKISEMNSQLNAKSLELTHVQQSSKSKDAELNDMQEQLNQRTQNFEKSIDWYKAEVMKKCEELSGSKEKISELKRELAAKDEFFASRQNDVEKSVTDYRRIQEAFVASKAENESLRNERELLIAQHQRRIEELQASFREKLNFDSGFDGKLTDALENERRRFEREKANIVQTIKHEHALEMEIQVQKFNEAVSRHKNDMGSAISEAKAEANKEVARLNSVISSLSREAELTKSSCDHQLESKHHELLLLQTRVANLDARLQEKEDSQSAANQNANQQLIQISNECQQLANENQSLKSQLQNALDDVQSLQKTVERECEERFELTEALSQAREALLKNHLQYTPGSFTPASVPSEKINNKLPQLETRLPDDVIAQKQNGNHVKNRDSSNERNGSKGLKPTPPPPRSREQSHRSTASSTRSKASAGDRPPPATDSAIAMYRATRNHRKLTGTGPEFKNLLNAAISRRSSTQ